MPIYKTKNENFFKQWTPEMAYVLGFFCADGNLTLGKRGNKYIEFTSTDKSLLKDIRVALGSNHTLTRRKRRNAWKDAFRLQIGSKRMFVHLIELGLTPKKSLSLKLPNVPDVYLGAFLRGYFDGDGNVVFGYFRKAMRNKKTRLCAIRFTSGSKDFLEQLKIRLGMLLGISGSFFYSGRGWRLNYGLFDSKKLFDLMYGKKRQRLIYLQRKYRILVRAFGTVAQPG